MKKQLIDPDLKTLLDLHKRDIFFSLNCHAIGIIQKFDATTQTARVSLNYLRRLDDGSTDDFGFLIDCPVIVLNGGKAALTMPIVQGDQCLVLFNDRDMDAWFKTGTVTIPTTQRCHSMTDAIVLVGLNPQSDLIENYDTSRVVLRNDKAMVGVGPSLIKISNDQYTLKSLIKELTDEIKSLITQVAAITVTCASPGSPSTPPINAAAITAISTQIAATQTKIDALLE